MAGGAKPSAEVINMVKKILQCIQITSINEQEIFPYFDFSNPESDPNLLKKQKDAQKGRTTDVTEN